MVIAGIIPARWNSKRFPGKVLEKLNGKPIIEHVYESVKPHIEHVFIAVDDKRIAKEARRFTKNVIITSPSHKCGTDRCNEALSVIVKKHDLYPERVMNIQADMPFIDPEIILALIGYMKYGTEDIFTPITNITSDKQLFDVNCVKVVLNKSNYAMYFSRLPIPYYRGISKEEWVRKNCYYKHIGIYCFKPQYLHVISQSGQTDLEIAESLEQNRWLQYGWKVRCIPVDKDVISVDTPKDIEEIEYKIDKIKFRNEGNNKKDS